MRFRFERTTSGRTIGGLLVLGVMSLLGWGTGGCWPLLPIVAIAWIWLWVRWIRSRRESDVDVTLPTIAIVTTVLALAVGSSPSLAFRLSEGAFEQRAEDMLAGRRGRGSSAGWDVELLALVPVLNVFVVQGGSSIYRSDVVHFRTGGLAFDQTGLAYSEHRLSTDEGRTCVYWHLYDEWHEYRCHLG